MTLPPLPELPTVFTTTEGDVHKLLKAYGKQCREAALEEAAQILSTPEASSVPVMHHYASAIRRLK